MTEPDRPQLEGGLDSAREAANTMMIPQSARPDFSASKAQTEAKNSIAEPDKPKEKDGVDPI